MLVKSWRYEHTTIFKRDNVGNVELLSANIAIAIVYPLAFRPHTGSKYARLGTGSMILSLDNNSD